jgi:hypothetical protein
MIYWRTVLLSDRSGLGGDTRPVGDQGKTRPGSTDFGVLVHDRLNSGIMLASKAVNGCCWGISEIVQGAGSSCTGLFHDVNVDHGGGDVGMTEKVLNCSRPHRSED